MTEDAEYCAEVLVDLSSRLEDRPLTYRIPPALRPRVRPGVRARVPLGPRTVSGFVLAVHPRDGAAIRALREILDVPDPAPLFSESLLALARWVAEETVSPLLDAVRCLVAPEVRTARAAKAPRSLIATLDHGGRFPGRAGPHQARILAALEASPRGVPAPDLVRVGGRAALRRLVARGAVRLAPAMADPASLPGIIAEPSAGPPASAVSTESPARVMVAESLPMLLWGDEEARVRWMIDAAASEVRRARQALITVPEIARARGLVDRLRQAIGDTVAAYHSDLPEAQHRATWWRLHAGEAGVVVGTRSALFAPFPRLGLIIVDDEQDPSYKADAAPRYHGRDVALHRGRITGIPVVLGSAAPSLETYAGVAAGRVRCLRPTPARVERVAVVDMREERRAGRGGLLSRPLVEAIRLHLRSGGRAALFVNRLGYARVLSCQECGHAVRCPRCDIPTPYDKETGTVRCRVCGYEAPAPDVCPRCRGIALRWVGAGTRRVEEVLRRLFPAVRTARVDRESAPAQEVFTRDAASGRIRLVVGTQLLLRSREFQPSLVGVIDADGPLYRPDFRAVERAYQHLRAILTLAAVSPGAETIVQTRAPDHPVFAALRTGDDAGLYDGELKIRREFGYPPYAHLARVIATGRDPESVRRLTARAADIARGCGVDVLGPSHDPRVRGRMPFRMECLLRSSVRDAVRTAARRALEDAAAARGSRLTVDIDPQEMH